MATFCLIHGNWHDGSSWDPLLEPLRARGHDALAPSLPIDDPRAGYEQRVLPALEALEDVDDAVVVVGHSVSSGYAALIADERPGSMLVHLCPRLGPFEPPPGAPSPFRPGFPFPKAGPDGRSAWEVEAAIDAMYPRLPPDMARAMAERLRPASPPVDVYPLPGHPDVPTALIYTTEDEFFEPEFERFMATRLLGIEPIELPGGHFPMAERPAELAEVLDRLARRHEAALTTG